MSAACIRAARPSRRLRRSGRRPRDQRSALTTQRSARRSVALLTEPGVAEAAMHACAEAGAGTSAGDAAAAPTTTAATISRRVRARLGPRTPDTRRAHAISRKRRSLLGRSTTGPGCDRVRHVRPPRSPGPVPPYATAHTPRERSSNPDVRGRRCHDGAPQMADPIFIVGNDRSGTTMLRLILDRGPEVAIPPESMFLTDFASAFDAGGPRDGAAAEQLMRQVWEHPKVRLWGIAGPPPAVPGDLDPLDAYRFIVG